MARRRIGVADVKEILVQWDAGEGISSIARSLGYTRPTVRKYLRAAERVGLRRGGQRYREPGWERLARAALMNSLATARTRHHSTLSLVSLAQDGRYHCLMPVSDYIHASTWRPSRNPREGQYR